MASLLKMLTKPFKVLSNCFQLVLARVVLIVTKPMKIVTNTIHIISSRTKPDPVAMNVISEDYSTYVENEYTCQKKEGEIIAHYYTYWDLALT